MGKLPSMNQYFPGDRDVRVGDSERNEAIAALSQFYAEGRLTETEADARFEAVTNAKTLKDLNELFTDLPGRDMVLWKNNEPTFTQSEVTELQKKGAKPRVGILALSALAVPIGLQVAVPELASVALTMLPVIVFILLFILKIGPSSWYAPSPRQLQRERLKELKASQAARDLERREAKREKTHMLTDRALDMANDFLKKNDRR